MYYFFVATWTSQTSPDHVHYLRNALHISKLLTSLDTIKHLALQVGALILILPQATIAISTIHSWWWPQIRPFLWSKWWSFLAMEIFSRIDFFHKLVSDIWADKISSHSSLSCHRPHPENILVNRSPGLSRSPEILTTTGFESKRIHFDNNCPLHLFLRAYH